MMRSMARGWRCHERRGTRRRPGRGRANSARRLGPIVGVLLVVVPSLGACTGVDDPAPPGAAAPVALEIVTVTGADQLPRAARADVEEAIGEVLSQYVVDGFLGTYPRGDFVRAYESFTPGLVPRAARDLDLLTATRYGDAASVVATGLRARLSLLVHRREAVGASAAVRFDFDATLTDGSTRPFSLRGRLLLQHRRGAWSLFGYDVRRDGEAVARGEAS